MISFDLDTLAEVSKKTIAQSLGIVLTLVEKGRVEATMPVDQRTHQPFGLLHGGASVVLAETVASIGGLVFAMDHGKIVVGQEINANHLRSVRSGIVKAVGLPIHIGRTTQVWEIKITDENDKLICISRCTLAVVDMPS